MTIRSRSDIQPILYDAIADIIITDLKAYYICDKIKLPSFDKLCSQAFVSALSAFDRDTDKIISKTLFKVTPQIHLDSLYEFAIHVLKSRWDEVVHLANENVCYLACKKTFMDLLRFLISNVDGISDEAHIIKRGDRYEVLGQKMKPVETLYFNESLASDIQVINKLVAFAPKSIFVHCDDEALQNSIQTIFGEMSTIVSAL